MTLVGELLFVAGMTITIECAVARSCGYGWSVIYRVALLNAVTNPFMNLTIIAMESATGTLLSPGWIMLVEGIVVLLEGTVYRSWLADRVTQPFRLSLIANAASYVAGVLLFGF